MKCLVCFGHVGSTFGVTIGLAHTHPTFPFAIILSFARIGGGFALAFAFTVIDAMTLAFGHFPT
jgi:hypothetical protein